MPEVEGNAQGMFGIDYDCIVKDVRKGGNCGGNLVGYLKDLTSGKFSYAALCTYGISSS